MADKPDILTIIAAAMGACATEGEYDPTDDYIKDPFCRRVHAVLGQAAAEIDRLRAALEKAKP
jgi:hypothetical protein